MKANEFGPPTTAHAEIGIIVKITPKISMATQQISSLRHVRWSMDMTLSKTAVLRVLQKSREMVPDG